MRVSLLLKRLGAIAKNSYREKMKISLVYKELETACEESYLSPISLKMSSKTLVGNLEKKTDDRESFHLQVVNILIWFIETIA